MWDWDRAVRLPLVMQKLERADPRVQAAGRIDLLAADRHDAYWIVRHRLTEDGWIPAGDLAADQEALAADLAAIVAPGRLGSR